MNYLIFIFRAAVEDFKRNKIRTLLTSLGILIGVASVVLLTAFGLGLKKFIENQFESLGTNIIIVLPGKIFENGSFQSSGVSLNGAKFDLKDINNLKKIKTVQNIIPAYIKSITASYIGKSEITSLYATNEEVFPGRNFEVEIGDKFTKADVSKKNKVAVIGPKIADKLFGNKNLAVGKSIKVESQSFKVIGILKAKGGGGFGGPDIDSFIIIPYTSGSAFNPDNTFTAINLKVYDKSQLNDSKAEINKILLKRYKDDEFSVVEQSEILNAVTSIFSVLNIILVGIAAISLVVGGIGIMNIMYVSVVERIREIGIRRAIGATRRDILLQFLSEAVILSLLGGILGLSIAFLSVLLIQRFFPAYIDANSVIVALGVSSAIGVFFGVFPARRASRLSPIEAIRYE